MITKEYISQEFQKIQEHICSALEQADGRAKFQEDKWQREEGGGGRTRVIASGKVLEKGAVNFSAVHGALNPKIANKLNLNAESFFATGVSLIMHPESPKVPISHANIRYFECSDGTWWFGGGIDLTPIYVDVREAALFHQRLKELCDEHDISYYDRFKQQADDYFYIPHRDETRGVGGIFFDFMNDEQGKSKEEIFEFVKAVGYAYAEIYPAIMNNKKSLSYTEQEKDWQLHRRGRYVEFNLVLDKGTKFGLETNGRTESILVSMPPEVRWTYLHAIEPNSPEAETISLLKKDINWISYL